MKVQTTLKAGARGTIVPWGQKKAEEEGGEPMKVRTTLKAGARAEIIDIGQKNVRMKIFGFDSAITSAPDLSSPVMAHFP